MIMSSDVSQDQLLRKEREKLVISFRQSSDNQVQLPDSQGETQASNYAARLFRKLKMKNCQLQSAVRSANQIIDSTLPNEEKIDKIEHVLNFWKEQYNLRPVQGALFSMIESKSRMGQGSTEIREKETERRQGKLLVGDKGALREDVMTVIDNWEQERETLVDFYEKEILKLHQMREILLKQFTGQVNRQKVEKQNLQKHIFNLTLESGMKSETRKTLEELIDNFKGMIKQLQQEAQKSQVKITTLQAEKEFLQDNLRRESSGNRNVSLELYKVQQELVLTTALLSSATKEREKGEIKITGLDKQMKRLCIDNQGLLNEKKIQEEYRKTAQEELRVTRQSLQQTSKELKKLSMNGETLQIQMQELQSQLSKNNKVAKQRVILQKKASLQLKQNQQLKHQIKALNFQKDILNNQFQIKLKKVKLVHENEMQEKISHYQNKLAKKRLKISELKRQKAQSQKNLRVERGQREANQVKLDAYLRQTKIQREVIGKQLSKAKSLLEQADNEIGMLKGERRQMDEILGRLDLTVDSVVKLDTKSDWINTLRNRLNEVLQQREQKERQKGYKHFFQMLREYRGLCSVQEVRMLRQKVAYILC